MTTDSISGYEMDIIRTIAALLNRVELKGSEVEAYNMCMDYLQKQAEALPTAPEEQLPH